MRCFLDLGVVLTFLFGIISSYGCDRDRKHPQSFVSYQDWPMTTVMVLRSTDGEFGSWHMTVSPSGLVTTVHNHSYFETQLSPVEVQSLTTVIKDCGTIPKDVTIGSMMPDQDTGIISLTGVRTQSIIKIEGLENVDFSLENHEQWKKYLSIWTVLENHAINSSEQSQLRQYIRVALDGG